MDTTVFRRLFHHVQIACSCDRDVATALDARLGRFPLAEPGQDDLVFDYRRVGPGGSHQIEPLSGPTRSIYNSTIGEVVYSDAEDRIYITCGDRVRVACDPRRGHTRISIVDFADEHLWLSTHPLFTDRKSVV